MKKVALLAVLMLLFIPTQGFASQCTPSGECLDFIVVDDIIVPGGGGQIVCHQVTTVYFLSNGTTVIVTEVTCY